MAEQPPSDPTQPESDLPEILLAQVDRVRGRMTAERFVQRLGRCLAGGLAVALAAVATPKIVALPGLPTWWSLAWLGAGVVVGLIAAAVWTAVDRPSRHDAAVELDLAFDLRERVASSLSLGGAAHDEPAAQALVEDARRSVERIDVADRVGVQTGRSVWLPVAPAAIALLLMALVSNREVLGTADAAVAPQATEEQAKSELEKTRKRLEERRKRAEQKKELADASGILKEVEKGVEELAAKEGADPKRAMVKMNDLAEQLAKERAKLGGGEELRKQIGGMKDLGRGPADKAADAMKRGDWKTAMKEIDKIRKQLASGEVSEEQASQLAEQLGKMQEKLADAVRKQEQMKQDLEQQLAEARRKGDLAQANKLQQKLDQAKAQQAQNQQMQQMAQQMQQAQEALKNGDSQQAADAMQQMAQQMQQMQMDAESMAMLDEAMTDLEMAKQGMMAEGMQGQFGMGQMGPMGPNPGGFPGQGNGMGEGQGGGSRPDERNATNFRDSKVDQNVGRGASTFGGLVRGPSIKGQVTEGIKQELTSADVAPADPLTSERLPRSRREHAEDYFKKLREEL
ncbi:Chromosome partition protein Smc [Pseudobythopirellula maris]|uniref:Chromosome partition protein Smc n=1 Tax=Pseudobythopirellula maris TaxID=2527991 RepID=A0A5C5ZPX4_9BACT|nr:hypothetical protein [Pseudobythopirellula maris]TWT88967.1 Chromosome partition protein Smc [Pseudobythopirellula maris]